MLTHNGSTTPPSGKLGWLVGLGKVLRGLVVEIGQVLTHSGSTALLSGSLPWLVKLEGIVVLGSGVRVIEREGGNNGGLQSLKSSLSSVSSVSSLF